MNRKRILIHFRPDFIKSCAIDIREISEVDIAGPMVGCAELLIGVSMRIANRSFLSTEPINVFRKWWRNPIAVDKIVFVAICFGKDRDCWWNGVDGPVARLSVQVPLQPAGRRVLVPLRCEVPPAPPHQPGEQATGVRRRHRPGVLRRRRELEPVRLARSDQPLGRRLAPGGRGCGTPKPRSDGQGSVA